MAENVTVTDLRIGTADLRRDIDSAKQEFTRFKRDVERDPIVIKTKLDSADLRRQVQAEVASMNAFRPAATSGGQVLGGIAGAGFLKGAGATGGAASGAGTAMALGGFTRGIGGAVASIAVIEGGIEAAGLAVGALGAAADAAKGDTKTAISKMADLGDDAKKLPGLVGFASRSLDSLLGFVTGATRTMENIEKETREMDAKTARMQQRNAQMASVNSRFEGITRGESDRRAREGGTSSELVNVREQIRELQQLIDSSTGRGQDKTRAGEAMAALRQHESELVGQAAGDREQKARDYENKLTHIMAEGMEARLHAAGQERAAERAALLERQRQARRADMDAIKGTPEEQVQGRTLFVAGESTRAAEMDAFDADRARKDDEERRKAQDEADREAQRQADEDDRQTQRRLRDIETESAAANRELDQERKQADRDLAEHLRPKGGGMVIGGGAGYGMGIQNAILANSGNDPLNRAASKMEKAADKLSRMKLVGVVED